MTDDATAPLPASEPSVGTIPTSRVQTALLGTVLAALAFAIAGGPAGIGAAALLSLAWFLTPPVVLATLGVFLFVTVQPGGVVAILTAIGLFLVLIAPLLRSAAPARGLLATIVLGIVFGSGVAWLTAAQSLAIAVGGLVLAVALVGYGLHRVAVVTVEAPPSREEVSDGG